MNTLGEMIESGLKKATREFTRAKMQAHGRREHRISQWQIDRWNKQDEEQQLKAAAYKVMPQAYKAVSDNGRLPANARQIYYQIRPLVLKATGGKIWKNSETFTQRVLNDYLNGHPQETADWDIVYDARGHFNEPHVPRKIGIGTLDVRGYLSTWDLEPGFGIHIEDIIQTHGPRNRYKFALFIEKEGFDELLAASKIAERFDLAIFSSKGQSTTATRRLVDELSGAGVTVLLLHDFDIAGFTIMHWLCHSNERYAFRNVPNVIDLGLRLSDVEELGLESEEQVHKQHKSPTEKFLDWDDDITKEERAFLRGEMMTYGGWRGQRVELNAMTSAQFVEWLEKKLKKAGVKKVVPDSKILAKAWKRALAVAKAREAIEEIEEDEPDLVVLPKNLQAKIQRLLKRRPTMSWDMAVTRIAEKHLQEHASVTGGEQQEVLK
jgi:DNA topoisomerase 6 subunit A-like protein